MEALLRWRHPVIGMIPPAEFLPLAESTGLIIPIGKWVLRSVCRQLGVWQQGGNADLAIAVNLSAVQFSQQNLLLQVGRILEETGRVGEDRATAQPRKPENDLNHHRSRR